MDFFSHILFGVLFATLGIHPFSFGWVFFAGIMAGLPDFDALLAPLNRIHRSFYFQHRGGSHSYLTAVIVALVVAAIITPFTGENFFVTWGLGAIFYSLHLTLDALTTYRTPLFYPIKKTMYKYDFERAVNPVLMFVSLGINLILLYAPWTEIAFQQVVTGIAIAYFAYLGSRIVLKLVVVQRSTPGTRFFPGTLPLNYYIYNQLSSETISEYQFLKRSALSHNIDILYDQKIEAGSPEFTWLEKARQQLPNGRFFGSWNSIIPIIDMQGDQVMVKLLFAEAYMVAATFSVTIEFNRESGQVVNVRQGFERLKPSQKK